MAKAIPEGLRSITPQLSVEGAAEAIEFYKKAFGATEVARAPDPTGKKIWHAQIKIGDSAIFVNDVMHEMGGSPSKASIWIYLDGVDAAWKRATEAGAKVTFPIGDQFWGDRTGSVTDPWGIQWNLAQHMKDLTPEQMKQAQDAFVEQMKQSK